MVHAVSNDGETIREIDLGVPGDGGSREKLLETTPAHFDQFCGRVLTLCRQQMGLHDWELFFKHERLEMQFSAVAMNLRGRTATFTLNTQWPDGIPLTSEQIQKAAKHEVLHLLTGDLACLAYEAFVSEAEIDTAYEALVHRLERLIPDWPSYSSSSSIGAPYYGPKPGWVEERDKCQ